jgi:hypothetical protein
MGYYLCGKRETAYRLCFTIPEKKRRFLPVLSWERIYYTSGNSSVQACEYKAEFCGVDIAGYAE